MKKHSASSVGVQSENAKRFSEREAPTSPISPGDVKNESANDEEEKAVTPLAFVTSRRHRRRRILSEASPEATTRGPSSETTNPFQAVVSPEDDASSLVVELSFEGTRESSSASEEEEEEEEDSDLLGSPYGVHGESPSTSLSDLRDLDREDQDQNTDPPKSPTLSRSRRSSTRAAPTYKEPAVNRKMRR